jgi:hypothetical protein
MNVFLFLHFFCFYNSRNIITTCCNKTKLKVVVADRNLEPNNDKNISKKTPVKYTLNSPNDYTIFITKKKKTNPLSGYDQRFPFFEDISKSRNHEFNEKLNLLRTLENPNVSNITKLHLIKKNTEMFSDYDYRKGLYRGFEEFLGK